MSLPEVLTNGKAWQVLQGDCLEVLRTLPDASVDAVVTDPPYGQTNEGYDTGVHPEVWAECFRVAKPGAALLSFAGSPTYHRLASAIEGAGWKVRQMWAWIYRDGMITSAWPREGFDRLAPAFDPICFATKGKCLLHLEREGENTWDRSTSFVAAGYSSRSQRSKRGGKGQGHYPRSLVATEGIDGFQYFLASRANSTRGESVGHPNQKPLSLLSWLIDKVPGETVLDPFMGSGTTGVAALQTGRRFLGIELDPGYFAVAEKRVRDAATDGPLFAAVSTVADERTLFDSSCSSGEV